MMQKVLRFALVLAVAGLGAGMAHAQNPNDSDLNSDGDNDLLWQEGVGHVHAWLMHGLSRTGPPVHTVPISEPGYNVVGMADFGSSAIQPTPDGHPDVFWRHPTTGHNLIWYMNGLFKVSSAAAPPLANTGWEIVSVGEFGVSATNPFPAPTPGQMRPDLLWRHRTTGQVVIWYLNGPAFVNSHEIGVVPDTNWRIVASGDFGADPAHADPDGRRDILWHHAASGDLRIWYMHGHIRTEAGTNPAGVSDTRWMVAGAGDFNLAHDGRTDIVWRHRDANQVVVWFMHGNALIDGAFTDPPAEAHPWRIVAPK
jgi:hypothetical protein